MLFTGITSDSKSSSLQTIIYVGASFVLFLSVITLSGWILGIRALASFGRDLVPMAPATAMVFLLQGLSLLLIIKKTSSIKVIRFLLLVSFVLALALGLLSLLYFSPEEVAAFDLRMTIRENWLWISPISALSFLLSFASMFCLMHGRRFCALVTILVVLASSLSQLIAYLYGAPLYYGWLIPPPLPTSLAFAFLSLSLLLLWVKVFEAITPVGQRKTAVILVSLVFAGLSAGLIAAGYYIHQDHTRHFRQEMEQVLGMLGDMQSAKIETWRNERINDARIIQSRLQWHCQPEEDSLQENGVVELIYQMGEYELIGLYDNSGNQLFTYPAHTHQQARELLSMIPQTREPELFFDLYNSPRDSSAHLALALPLFCKNQPGDHRGYVIMRMDPRKFLFPSIERNIPFSRTAETFLIRYYQDHVVFLNQLLFGEHQALSLSLPVDSFPLLPAAMAARGFSGITEGLDYAGQRVLASVHAVKDSPWHVIAKMNTSDITLPMQRHLTRTVMLILALIGVSGLLLFYFWKQYQSRNLKKELQADRLLKRTLMELDFHLNNTSLGLVEWDRDFRVRRWSKQSEAIFGWTQEQVKGKAPQDWDFFYQEDAAASAQNLQNILSGEISTLGFVSRHNTRHGEIIHCRWYVSVLKDEENNIHSILSLVQDITSEIKARMNQQQINLLLEKQVEQRTSQLRATIRELDAFSYSISHDLRSPLLVVEGFSRMLDEDYSEVLDEEGRKIIATIVSGCAKMDQLINDLLQLSRTSREEINKSRVDMKAMALSVYQETARAEESARVTLEMGELHAAAADPALIRQVWQNLLSNALKYSRKNPQPMIRVSSHVQAESIVFSVEDNGAGFNPDQAHKIFTPFQRLHAAQDFEGNGVGLAIVQRIVRRHGGEVGARGEENKGATFWFSLPIGSM